MASKCAFKQYNLRCYFCFICESSDCFGKAVNLPSSVRNYLVAIRSTGAYGAVMSSAYNMRDRVEEMVV
jgi:diaminopimelate decarboxylase